jgi:S-formylglutathione hydrolase FrmB
VFAELAHERFCRPHPTAVSGPLDEQRQAFVDITLEVSMHTACKAANGAAFAKASPNKPPGYDAKAKKAAAEKRKAAAAPATTNATGTNPGDGTKPPTTK